VYDLSLRGLIPKDGVVMFTQTRGSNVPPSLCPTCSIVAAVRGLTCVKTVPVNLKDEDKFHITIEDYLLALTTTIEELARLAPNAVTLGDYARPLQISKFIKDVHAGFQLLNLKNDILRRRTDGIKYSVKKVEDVVYDLSLRGLIPKDGA
jgi:predicted translin family RNA/ssDNA-binding protein